MPSEAGPALLNCLRDPVVVAGGFWKVFREKHPLRWGSRLRCALRLLLFGRVLGDQVMFIRRSALEQIGGVPDVPLMEEFELCRRLRNLGLLALASATVSTSARRFAKLGVLRTYARMWRVTLGYHLGTSTRELRDLYEKD
jgi:GT2 family glycosyltransferase